VELKATNYDVSGHVATLTLSRPHRRNAWTGQMHTEFRWLLQQAEQDPGVRVLILTGDGDDFCVGADFKALEGFVKKGAYDSGTGPDLAKPGYGVAPQFDHAFAYMMALETPIIAAVNGAAAGAGLVLACYCDLRFAARGSLITAAHGPIGLPPEFGLSWLLPRLIGLTRANDVLISSRKFLAEETEGWGLFNEILEPDQLMPHVREYAEFLATAVAPSSLRAAKRQIYLDQHRDVGSAVADSVKLSARMIDEPDFREGVAAFIEKRTPRWG
jgi:enoyl-CoA hydratase/carnithine racemase